MEELTEAKTMIYEYNSIQPPDTKNKMGSEKKFEGCCETREIQFVLSQVEQFKEDSKMPAKGGEELTLNSQVQNSKTLVYLF